AVVAFLTSGQRDDRQRDGQRQTRRPSAGQLPKGLVLQSEAPFDGRREVYRRAPIRTKRCKGLQRGGKASQTATSFAHLHRRLTLTLFARYRGRGELKRNLRR